MSNLPPVIEGRSKPKRFTKFAAVFSILAPFLAICTYKGFCEHLLSLGRVELTMLRFAMLFAAGLVLSGLGLGLVASVTAWRQHRKGLFSTAIIGTCLNGLLLASLIVGPYLLPRVFGHKAPITVQGRLKAATKKLAAASTAEERFYALDDAAKESFNAGKIDDANKFARELLKLAPKYKDDWNYGNAIQDGNLVLGRIAVRDGNIEKAKQYLLAAGKSPGSPQMDSFGPNMSLAKDLLEKGQRQVVLQYFGLCRKFWKMDYGKLDQWSKEVKAGKIPDFGANLVY